MSATMSMFAYLAVGAVGGFIGHRLKFSGGILIGSMVAVILFKMLVHKDVAMPFGFRFFIQILIGVMVGATFNLAILPQLKALIWPVIFSTTVLMSTGLLTTFVLAKWGILDIPTAYISTSPGAMNTLLGLAIDRGANATLVVAFHFFRLTFINLTAPFIFALLAWWFGK